MLTKSDMAHEFFPTAFLRILFEVIFQSTKQVILMLSNQFFRMDSIPNFQGFYYLFMSR
jgi:hypothetical protein